MFSEIYPDYPCANQSIDNLDIPDECSRTLKRTGVEYIGDVLSMYARIHSVTGGMDTTPRMSAECYIIIVRKLIAIDCWPWPDKAASWLKAEE